ncbi:hypothetical protein BaRGS_00029470 [Batillaria attramentaria]|uniref:Uncharacterized protein n=1 Tax=Batillaria attramentaria TaxID=370345 RepID=A0ABD0JW41_9CAEN
MKGYSGADSMISEALNNRNYNSQTPTIFLQGVFQLAIVGVADDVLDMDLILRIVPTAASPVIARGRRSHQSRGIGKSEIRACVASD